MGQFAFGLILTRIPIRAAPHAMAHWRLRARRSDSRAWPAEVLDEFYKFGHLFLCVAVRRRWRVVFPRPAALSTDTLGLFAPEDGPAFAVALDHAGLNDSPMCRASSKGILAI